MRTCGVYACAFYCNGQCLGDDKFWEYSKCVYHDAPLIKTNNPEDWGKIIKRGSVTGIGVELKFTTIKPEDNEK